MSGLFHFGKKKHGTGTTRTGGKTVATVTTKGLVHTTAPEPAVSERQREVIRECTEIAEAESKAKKKLLVKKLKKYGYSEKQLEAVRQYIRTAELTINFDPNKSIPNKGLVIDVMMASDRYKNAFEIGFSGGAPVSFKYEGRNKVECELFHYPDFTSSTSPPEQEKSDRPKYIGLNLFLYGSGAATGSTYGESALVLKPYLRQACTLTTDDSFGVGDPTHVGTFEHFDHLLYHLAMKKSENEFKGFFNDLLGQVASPRRPASRTWGYWEVQVHATVRLPDDVAYLRSSFRHDFGTAGGRKMGVWAVQLGIPHVWAWQRDQMFIDPWANFGGLATYNPDVLLKFDEAWKRAESKKSANIASIIPKTEWDLLWSTVPLAMRYTPETDTDDSGGIKKT